MKQAILSDIHANITAFDAVLDDCEQRRVDDIICLGDCIGYGPDPEAVVQKVNALALPTVIGNHEMALTRQRFLKWFNPVARQSLEAHFGWLSLSSQRFIGGWPSSIVQNQCRFVHGFPPQSPTRYLFQMSDERVLKIINRLSEQLYFIGHTHEVRLLAVSTDQVDKLPIPFGEPIPLDDSRRYIINVGSVGQPRDGTRDAKYVIWDSSRGEIQVCCVPFDGKRVADRILSLGLPSRHADFLR